MPCLHLQYALHTTGLQEQPLSDKSLSRFRKRKKEDGRLGSPVLQNRFTPDAFYAFYFTHMLLF